MAETIDIFNANLEPIGAMERIKAHMEAHWHKTFHCWVVSTVETPNGSLLFQLRSPEMINFPNLLDVSAAGHLEVGEAIEEGIREVSEELGFSIDLGRLYSLGYRVEVADQANGQKNREYQAVYILQSNLRLPGYRPQVEEVTGLIWLDIQDGIKLFSGKVHSVIVSGIRYDKTAAEWQSITKTITLLDFLPRIQNYYLTICIMAERLVEEKFPLSIS